ncbi:hypothetical protein C1H46_025815 [Malus baccata]|uniref:Uncharacterized protein n=1 Tax=Malus baccata TaxID=106549 RepID=A0A540LQ55_MALBA|nr:hypothetical protein C1H46_025815 [Malus baccata]
MGVAFSTYSSAICNKPGEVREGLVAFALILLVLAALHVVEPIARNKSVGYNKDEYWKKLLQHLRLVALIVVLFFLGYQQSKIHTNNWLWGI